MLSGKIHRFARKQHHIYPMVLFSHKAQYGIVQEFKKWHSGWLWVDFKTGCRIVLELTWFADDLL